MMPRRRCLHHALALRSVRSAATKTVLRGGYGIFNDSAEEREIDGAADIYPYVSRGESTHKRLPNDAPADNRALFPSFATPGPVTPAANSFLAVSQSHHRQNPYVQQWSFSIQRALTSNSTLEVYYIGNKGTHLLMRHNFAQSLPPNLSIPLTDPRNICSGPEAIPQLRRLHQQPLGREFHLQCRQREIRAAHRVDDFLVGLHVGQEPRQQVRRCRTSARAETAGWQGFLNNHDIALDRGRSGFDVDHRLVNSFLYQLPFGRGGKYSPM